VSTEGLTDPSRRDQEHFPCMMEGRVILHAHSHVPDIYLEIDMTYYHPDENWHSIDCLVRTHVQRNTS
jgi:hypothetical protein